MVQHSSSFLLSVVWCSPLPLLQLLVDRGPFHSYSLRLTTNTHSFDTLVRRQPATFTTIIDRLCCVGRELTARPHGLSSTIAGERVEAGKAIAGFYQPIYHVSSARRARAFAYWAGLSTVNPRCDCSTKSSRSSWRRKRITPDSPFSGCMPSQESSSSIL